MIFGFTGHRDAQPCLEKLIELAEHFPNATWLTGGAIGFDSMVEDVARKYGGIKNHILKPDYKTHGRGATFIRNRQIVDGCDTLICYYDGRKTGGTKYTVEYARKKGVNVVNVYPEIT